MTMFIDVPLWDEPAPEIAVGDDDPNMIRLDDGLVKCRHCGEVEINEYVWSISHSMAFNGWCGTHILMNHGANPSQHEWLAEHGFTVVDRFDERYWDLP
jgi:hypothetical protein